MSDDADLKSATWWDRYWSQVVTEEQQKYGDMNMELQKNALK